MDWERRKPAGAGHPPPRAGGRRRLRVLGELVESLGEPLQLLLIAVAIPQGIWGELREHVQQGRRNVIGRARQRRRSLSTKAAFGYLGYGQRLSVFTAEGPVHPRPRPLDACSELRY